MKKAALYSIILMVCTLLAKVLGFVREQSLAFTFGVGTITDAYVVAFSLPSVIVSGVGSAILTVYISIAMRLKTSSEQRAKEFTDTVITLVFILSVIVLGVFLLLDNFIVGISAVGFTGESLALAVRLADIMMLSIPFIGIYFVLQGYLNVNGSFLASGLVSVPTNICIIASFFLASSWGLDVLGYAETLGYILTFLMLLLVAFKKDFSYRPRLCFDENILELLKLIIPIFIGKTITQINSLIDRSIASTLPSGGISALSFGNRIIGFMTSVFVMSISTVIFPQMSKLSAENGIVQLKRIYSRSAGIVSLIMIPLSVGLMVFSKELVAILFMRGRFDEAALATTSGVVMFYSFGLVAFGLKDIMVNVFYALSDTKLPMLNALLALGLNTVLNLLMRPLGAGGLALATSISGTASLVIMAVSLKRRIGRMGYKKYIFSAFRILVAALAMVYPTRLCYNVAVGAVGSISALVLATLAGMLIYFVMCIVLRVKEMGIVVVALAEKISEYCKRKA